MKNLIGYIIILFVVVFAMIFFGFPTVAINVVSAAGIAYGLFLLWNLYKSKSS